MKWTLARDDAEGRKVWRSSRVARGPGLRSRRPNESHEVVGGAGAGTRNDAVAVEGARLERGNTGRLAASHQWPGTSHATVAPEGHACESTSVLPLQRQAAIDQSVVQTTAGRPSTWSDDILHAGDPALQPLQRVSDKWSHGSLQPMPESLDSRVDTARRDGDERLSRSSAQQCLHAAHDLCAFQTPRVVPGSRPGGAI